VVHRSVHAFLAGHRDPAAYPTHDELVELCAHLDASTRTAAMAERQMRKSLWLVTLARAVASDPRTRFSGRVTGVGAKGLFVTLDGSHVSGMVTLRSLPGRGWGVSPDGMSVVDGAGHRHGYGDAVSVEVDSADVESGQLELKLVTAESSTSRSAGRPRRRTSAAVRSG
jgi:ribonuclease R